MKNCCVPTLQQMDDFPCMRNVACVESMVFCGSGIAGAVESAASSCCLIGACFLPGVFFCSVGYYLHRKTKSLSETR